MNGWRIGRITEDRSRASGRTLYKGACGKDGKEEKKMMMEGKSVEDPERAPSPDL